MQSISALEARAAKIFKSAFKVADAEIAQIPTSEVNKSQSIGTMLANIAQAAANDPNIIADRISKKLNDAIAKGEQIILTAKANAQDLEHAVAYLNGDSGAYNQIIDSNLKSHAYAVRNGADAGLIDAIATAKQINRYLVEVKEIIDHLETKYIAQTKSAASIAAGRARWLASIKSSSHLSSFYQKRLERLKLAHKLKFHQGTK